MLFRCGVRRKINLVTKIPILLPLKKNVYNGTFIIRELSNNLLLPFRLLLTHLALEGTLDQRGLEVVAHVLLARLLLPCATQRTGRGK